MGGHQKDSGFWGGASGGIFMIGIGLIFLLDIDFFPWILLVIGLSSLPGSLAKEGLWAGVQGFIWMAGLAILFATDTLWPGILILIGLSTLGGALFKPPVLEGGRDKPKRGVVLADGFGKPKRGIPTPDDDEDEDAWNEAEPVSERRSTRD